MKVIDDRKEYANSMNIPDAGTWVAHMGVVKVDMATGTVIVIE